MTAPVATTYVLDSDRRWHRQHEPLRGNRSLAVCGRRLSVFGSTTQPPPDGHPCSACVEALLSGDLPRERRRG